MGTVCGSGESVTPEQKKALGDSKEIDQNLRDEEKKKPNVLKLLLLGTGDAGKSTFTKQLAFIYGTATQNYLNTFTEILRDNCLDGIHTLFDFMEESGGGIPVEIKDSSVRIIQAIQLKPEVAAEIMKIKDRDDFKEKLLLAVNANIQGGVPGAQYYFDNAARFADPEFVPTKADVLMARRKTVGIIETTFSYNNATFTLVDVGGQRSERKKWLHCFANVTAVIFLTAINEYDMVLEEDSSTNRLLESLKLWKALTSSQFFRLTPFILFLNKSDLFEEKLKRIPLCNIFSDFEQVTSTDKEFSQYSNFEKSWRFIQRQFHSHFEGYTFYPHLTNVLDSELCKKVFVSIQETVIKEGLKLNSLL